MDDAPATVITSRQLDDNGGTSPVVKYFQADSQQMFSGRVENAQQVQL